MMEIPVEKSASAPPHIRHTMKKSLDIYIINLVTNENLPFDL